MLFSALNRIYELNILEYLIILLPGAISAAFALIRINDIPLTKYLFLFLEFAIKPKKRVWDHRGIAYLVDPDLTPATIPSSTQNAPVKTSKPANLRELSKMLDSGAFAHLDDVTHQDLDKTHDDDLVTQAYFGHKSNHTENMYWRTKASHLEMLKIFAQLPVTQLKKGTKETAIAREEIMKVKAEVEANQKERANEEKKKAGRKRKRKTAKPIRSNHPVNTIQKHKPVAYQAPVQPMKNKVKSKNSEKPKNKNIKPNPKKSDKNLPNKDSRPFKKGEFTFEELSDKDAIEINLD